MIIATRSSTVGRFSSTLGHIEFWKLSISELGPVTIDWRFFAVRSVPILESNPRFFWEEQDRQHEPETRRSSEF